MKKEKIVKSILYLLIMSLIINDIVSLLLKKCTIFRGITFSIKVIILAVFIVYFDN